MSFLRLSLILGAVGLLPVAPAVAAPVAAIAPTATQSASKEEFIQGMANRVLAVLSDRKSGYRQQQATLRTLFTEMVDIDWIAKFVLGPTWKIATPEQKARYVELYRTYITEGYISKFDEESAGKVRDIKLLGIQEAAGGTFSANTQVVQAGNEPPVKVDYRLHPTPGGFKVIDITIEGVSLLTTHRQEFAAIANDGGMDGVIAKLQQLAAQASAAQ